MPQNQAEEPTPFVSIIIPVRAINDYIRRAMLAYQDLDYDEFEILIFPDQPDEECFPNTRIIASGPVGPAEKRDLAMTYARGDIYAFIDDDAYPEKNWLTAAVRHFSDPSVAAVGGPAMTPPDAPLLQQASGAVFESRLGGGPYTYRYIPGEQQEIDDYPSVNLLVRADVFRELNGFDCTYYPGEDTKLCLDIVRKLEKRIIYDPDARIWHHRRPLFIPHLKQIGNYAVHRGYFAKRFPQTSFRPSYFLPSLFALGLVFGPLILHFLPAFASYAYMTVVTAYLVALLYVAYRQSSMKLAFLVPLGIVCTHLVYGFGFLWGLARPNLRR